MKRFAPRRMVAALAAALVLLAAPATSVAADSTLGSWRKANDMVVARTEESLTLLPNGTVLAVGTTPGDWETSDAVELFDPATRRWRRTGSLNLPRIDMAVTQLADGDVLVAGGSEPGAAPAASAERYDAGSGQWQVLGGLATPRRQPALATLLDGRVLLVGGYRSLYDDWDDENAWGDRIIQTAEMLNPVSGEWSSAASPPLALLDNSLTTLADGGVLSVGGATSTGYPYEGELSAAVHRYDPVLDRWDAVAALTQPRAGHTALALTDGRVLALGGQGEEWTSGEVYDPVADTWTQIADLPVPMNNPAAALLADGRVLVSGAQVDYDTWQASATSMVYDSVADQWSQAPAPRATRRNHALIGLPDGRAVAAGGVVWDYYDEGGASTESEMYDPRVPFQPAITFQGPSRVRPGGEFRATAVLRDAGTAESLPSEILRFTVLDQYGQWSYAEAVCEPVSCQTDADGTVGFSYRQWEEFETTERVEVFADLDGNYSVDPGEPFAAIDLRWADVPTKITAGPVVEPAAIVGGDPYRLTARLTELETGKPLAGQSLIFSDGQVMLCEATTNSDGMATCSGQDKKIAALRSAGYRVRFDGTDEYEPTQTRGELVAP